MNSKKRYINVILPLPLKGTFTYFTYLDNLLIGQRVVVQFGVRKLYSAIISKSVMRTPSIIFSPRKRA